MALEKTSEIDSIGIDNQTGVVILSIIDDLNWENENYHLNLLQEKINIYLSFIESGEIYETYPNAKNRVVEIKIYFKHELVESGFDFINNAKTIIEESGFKLSHKIM